MIKFFYCPALVDGDVTIFDSNAILLYLAEMTGKLETARKAMFPQNARLAT